MKKYLFNLALIALSVLLFQVAHAASNSWQRFPYYQSTGGGACSNTIQDSATGPTNTSVGTTGAEALATNIENNTGSTYSADTVTLEFAVVGSPTGNLSVYIYDADNAGAEGPPDDLVATADSTADVSTFSSTCSTPTSVDFDFSTPATISNDSAKTIVIHYDGDDSNYVFVCNGNSFIGPGAAVYTRAGTPGTSNDSANWTTTDINGSLGYETYECQ